MSIAEQRPQASGSVRWRRRTSTVARQRSFATSLRLIASPAAR
jgi:hypothetical protein